MEKLQILLSRFQDDSATDIEKRELLEELSLNEETLKQLLRINFERIVQNGISTLSGKDAQELFQLIQSKKEPGMTPEAHFPRGHERVSVIRGGGQDKRTNPRVFIKPALRWVAVAVVTGVIFLGGIIWHETGSVNGSYPDRIAYDPVVQKTDTIINSASGTLQKTLADGSVIWLEKGSVLTFAAPFGAAERAINLTGKATFQVAKDSSRPFTVLANGLTATALGTKFSVDMYHDDVRVRLFEGKVVVKSLKPGSAPTYLLPGDQFNMNMRTFQYTKTPFNVGGRNKHSRPLTEKRDGLTLQFNRTPLNEVFDKLSKRYKVEIKYNLREVYRLPFTGSFEASDSLKTLLDVLCNTNDLRYQEKEGAFHVTK